MVKVTLVNSTERPHETLYWAFMNMHNPIPDSLDKIDLSEEELKSFIKMLSIQPHQTVFEYINFAWLIEEGSRALQQQLTRTRQASFSIQSLRIVDVGMFADNKQYLVPDKIQENDVWEKAYDVAIKDSENSYRTLIDLGVPTEDARNVLPLSIHSPITMNIDLRSLSHMLSLRLCSNTQGEFREVAKQMKQEIADKVCPLLAGVLQPLCFSTKTCPSPVPCDEYDFPQAIKMDVSRWIKG